MISSPDPVERCAVGADRRGDPMVGTAPPAYRFLLVEQTGPWGRDALLQSRLDPAVGAGLDLRAAGGEMRVLLIRRPGRPQPPPRPPSWAYVDTRQQVAWWGRYADPRELLDVPLDGSAGNARTAATYLVCAHGRHDACCAIRGRALAAELAAAGSSPGAADVWECSHVGGDRFAPNVVVLPYGLYYGSLPVGSAAALLTATEAGEVEPGWLRGRSGSPPAVQAAEIYLRQQLGVRSIGAPAGLGAAEVAPGRWAVRLRLGGQLLQVTVQATRGPAAARLTCAATVPLPVPAWRGVSIEDVTPASPRAASGSWPSSGW